eukprot:3990071-Alexandrium_andersonii.AAC.1
MAHQLPDPNILLPTDLARVSTGSARSEVSAIMAGLPDLVGVLREDAQASPASTPTILPASG